MDTTEQTVLVIDDGPEDRVAFRRYLTLGLARPYRILEAELGCEGLRLWHAHRPDCVLLDYHLPDRDGLQVLAAMGSGDYGEALPVVMLTMRDDLAIAAKSISAGAQDYLVKDELTAESLQRAVANTIERMRLHRERIQALATLKMREERLRLALAAGNLSAWEWQPSKDTFTADDRLLELFGLAPETFDGTITSILHAVHPEDRQRVEDSLRQAVAKNTRYEAEFRVVHPDGLVCWLRAIGHPEHDETGAPVRLLGFSEDITGRKRVEAERIELLAREHKARLAAEAALRSREAFLAVASHELKTPLTTMLGNLYLIQRRLSRSPGLSERDSRALKVVEAQGNRLKRMINAMLDVSYLQMDELQLECVSFDLGTLVQHAVDEERLSISDHTLIYQGIDEPLIVKGDLERLTTVIHALLGNALKYSPLGGPVEVRVARNERYAVITVSDGGIGIASDLLPLLMQPFARASIDYRHFSGMGVGLYLSNMVVALHGGSLTIASEPGVGSVVTVMLPLATVTQDGVAESPSLALAMVRGN